MLESPEFSFLLSKGSKEKSLFIEIYGGGVTPDQPQILLDLLEELESGRNISLLREKFPEHIEVLGSLEMELARGKVIVVKREGCEFNHGPHGYSIRVRVELIADSRKKE